ncbi:MAG: ABC transporter substrate-binding protein [Archaeoglobaceae archaeon]
MKVKLGIVLALAIVLVLSACQQPAPTPTPTTPAKTPTPTTPVATPTTPPATPTTPVATPTTPPATPTTTPPKPTEFGGTIYIGYTGPLSGAAALYGQNCLDGIKFAVEDINKAGGIVLGDKWYKLEVVAIDDKYSPTLAVSNAEKIFDAYKAPIIFCPHSGGILAMQKINEQRGFVIGAYSSSPAIVQGGNKMMFMIPPNFEITYVPFLSDYFLERGYKKAAMMQGTHEYGILWGEQFKKYWTLKGGQIVAEAPINYYLETDFYPYVSKVLAANPEVILLVGPSEPLARVIKIARELGYTGGFLLAEQAKLEEIMNFLGIQYDFATKTVKKGDLKLVEKVVGTSAPCALTQLPETSGDPLMPGYKEVCDRLQPRLGGYPVTWEHALHYQAMLVIGRTLEKAGSTDPKRIMEALEKETFPADGYLGMPNFIYTALLRISPYGTVGAFNTPGSAMVCWGGTVTGFVGIMPKFWGQEYSYRDAEGKVVWG